MVTHNGSSMNVTSNASSVTDPIVVFDLSDPWQVSAIILFGLLATIAIYRSVRACCVCTLQTETDP